MEDSKILELFFARNEDAIKYTDETYGRRLYHLADKIVQNGQDAEILPWTSWTGKMPQREKRKLSV